MSQLNLKSFNINNNNNFNKLSLSNHVKKTSTNKLSINNDENEFFSSGDSDEEYLSNNILSRRKSLLRKGIQSNLTIMDPKNIDIFPEKREKNLNSMNELRRLHHQKENKLKNIKIGWNILYDLIFCDYFNELRAKKNNYYLFGNNDDVFFNIKEIELRIKKLSNNIFKKKKINNDESFTMPETKWEDQQLYSIINNFKIDDREKNNYIPIYLNTFKNFKEKDLINIKKKPSSPSYFKKLDIDSNIHKRSNIPLLSNPPEQSRKRKSVAISPSFGFSLDLFRNINSKFGSNTNVKSLRSKKSLNKFDISKLKKHKNNCIYINYNPFNTFEGNKLYNEKVELLRNNKKFFETLIEKYPKYEEDIINIKNNFLVYDIELTKNEGIFKSKDSILYKHFFDFHYDFKNKGVKKVPLSDTLLKQSKNVDQFIEKFNKEMRENTNIKKINEKLLD